MKNRVLSVKRMRIGFIILFVSLFCLPFLNAASLGDVNSSSAIDIIDGLMISQYYAGLNPPEFTQSAADTNSDGVINLSDALLVAQYYAGLISSFPGTSTSAFITKSGSKLYDGTKQFRFVSINVPNYLNVEDRAATTGEKWHRITAFEQRDAVRAVKRMGGQVFRTYTFSVQGGVNVVGQMAHIIKNTATGAIEYNEALFIDTDRGIAIAREEGVRLFIPLVDNWQWFGGYAEWAALAGGGDFWTDTVTKTAFKTFLTYLLNRTNTVTGVKYMNDPTIMAWELGNEIDKANATWLSEMAAHIKSIDKNHLIIDGGHKTIPAISLTDPNIDIVTTHYTDSSVTTFAQQAAASNKAYIYGEFSPDSTSQVQSVVTNTISSGAAGCLIWSLRFRTEVGGFYFHSDFNGASDSLQYPGFTETAPGSEREIFTILKTGAYQIQGLSVPADTTPSSPLLLPITSAAIINWQGCAGAYTYNVERSPGTTGTWTTIATGVIDAKKTTYNSEIVALLPLYSDYPGTGTWSYRITAVNPAGSSQPSNVVTVTQ